MKQVFKLCAILIAISIPFSCNKQKHNGYAQPKTGQTLIAAFFIRPDGQVDVGAIYRVIKDEVKIDTVTGTKKIVTDTVFFCPRYVAMLDSLKKPLLDSLKNPRFEKLFFFTGKDSVWVNLSNIDLDSLSKVVLKPAKG